MKWSLISKRWNSFKKATGFFCNGECSSSRQRQATVEPQVFQPDSMTHRGGIVPITVKRFPWLGCSSPYSFSTLWSLALLAETVSGQDLAGGFVHTRPDCQMHLFYSSSVLEMNNVHGCRCEYALISAKKIPGTVNQSLRSLPCSYIKLSGELSVWFCMLQLQMTNMLSKFLMNWLLSLAFKLPHLTSFNPHKHIELLKGLWLPGLPCHYYKLISEFNQRYHQKQNSRMRCWDDKYLTNSKKEFLY